MHYYDASMKLQLINIISDGLLYIGGTMFLLERYPNVLLITKEMMANNSAWQDTGLRLKQPRYGHTAVLAPDELVECHDWTTEASPTTTPASSTINLASVYSIFCCLLVTTKHYIMMK